MAKADHFRIAYVGGGSRFVVTLLHGLAARAQELRALGRPVELFLMDPATERAEQMARYAAVTADQTRLPISATVTPDLPAAIDGADWVIYSAGTYAQEHAALERFGRGLPAGISCETGARTAISAAAVWPGVREIAEEITRSAPGAVFSTLVNPADVTAAAVQRRYGIPSIGMCVEVGGLIGFLAYYLREPAESIRLEHVGVNHCGWCGRWTVGGAEGDALFRRRIPQRIGRDDWYPHCNTMVRLHEAVGCLRSSAYHNWPYPSAWDAACDEQNRRWHKACLGDWPSRRDYRQARLDQALGDGRMIPEADGTQVHPEATPYTYPDTRHVLGALAAGLAGGSAGPVALQVRNGDSNPTMPPEAWIEVPTRVDRGRLVPQPVTPPPAGLVAQVRLVAEQRSRLADWLAFGDRQALAEALLALPDGVSVDVLLDLAESVSTGWGDARA
jgi:alpha-galactosidase/6-phospho-beta-glucosidase family protein